jgi:hypothetical protein
MGQLGILSKGGKHIVLDGSNILLIAYHYRYYPATI